MKNFKIWILLLLPICVYQKVVAQTVNWNSVQNAKHIITAGAGWDYSISYNLGYAYQIKTTMPIILNSNISVPSGEKVWDDFKTKMGAQILLLNTSNVKGSVALNLLYRKYQNPLVTLQNIGTDLKATVGYYKLKWFVAGEIGWDNAIFTHFKHSQTFRQTIYANVKDGWNQHPTGGNIHYGIQTGYSFKKSDITFQIGKVTTQNFKTTPLIPYYLFLGYNFKI